MYTLYRQQAVPLIFSVTIVQIYNYIYRICVKIKNNSTKCVVLLVGSWLVNVSISELMNIHRAGHCSRSAGNLNDVACAV